MFRKEIWWKQLEKRRPRGGYWKPPCGRKKSSPFGLISSIISNDVTVNGGLGSESSRNDPTFQVYEWLECIEICPGPLLMFQSKALLEMPIWRVQLYESTILKPYFENIPTIDLGIFFGLITVQNLIACCISICVPTPEMKSHPPCFTSLSVLVHISLYT